MTHGDPAQLARGFLALWNETGDPEVVGARFWHDDIVWIEPRDSPMGSVFKGRAAVERLCREWTETMGPTRAVFDEVIVVEDEVLACLRLQLHGAASGLELDAPIHFLGRVRDDRFDRIRVFAERTEALAALHENVKPDRANTHA